MREFSRPYSYPDELRKEALELYFQEIDGVRIYQVKAIPLILEKKYGYKVSKVILHHWVKQYKYFKKDGTRSNKTKPEPSRGE